MKCFEFIKVSTLCVLLSLLFVLPSFEVQAQVELGLQLEAEEEEEEEEEEEVKLSNSQIILNTLSGLGIDIEKEAVQIGTASNPLKIQGGGIATLDFHMRHGSIVHVSGDPHVEMAGVDDIAICDRDDMNCSAETSKTNWPKVEATCQHGKWSLKYGGGECIRPFGCCYRNRVGAIYVDHGCRRVNSSSTVTINTKHHSLTRTCDSADDYLDPKDKEYCLYDYNNSPGNQTKNGVDFVGGVSGDTDDDMFRVTPGAEVYMTYRRPAEGDYNSIFIEDTRPEGSRDIMIASGPPTDYSDWENFVDNPPEGIAIKKVPSPTGTASTYGSCPPIVISLCNDIGDSLPPPPVVDADCGLADDDSRYGVAEQYKGPTGDGYVNVTDIPSEGLCAFGDPVFPASQNNPNKLTWSCAPPPILGGGAIDSCETPRMEEPEEEPEEEAEEEESEEEESE